MQAATLRDGVRAALPLTLAPLLFGASFDLLAVDAGMGHRVSARTTRSVTCDRFARNLYQGADTDG